MKFRLLAIGAAATLATAVAVNANAQAGSHWWPVKVLDLDSGSPKVVDYTPVTKAAKPWNICVLFPHMKDTFWLAVDYGVVEEARELGVNMTLYQAGGYTNLPKQLSQFDDCLSSNYDAIVVGPISEAGLAREFAKGMKSGKPIISTVNPVFKAPVTSKMDVDFTQMGVQTGKFLVQHLNGQEAKIGAFPGPAGSGWAEQFLAGFKEAINGHKNITLETAKFGDSGVAIQLRLIQNALQAYPDMNVIWGCAPAAEAAIGAIAEAGRPHIQILSAYENQAMLDDMKKNEILGFATQYAVLEGRVAIDTAVRVLEHKPYMKYIQSIPDPISNDNLDKINMSLVLAPPGFQATYQVKAH